MRKLHVPVNLLVAVLMVLSVALLTGARAVASPTRATTITLASWSTGKIEGKTLTDLVKTFENKYHINVDYQIISGDYTPAMKARIVAGTTPDVFYMNSDVAQEFIRTNQLKNLDFLAKDKSYGLNKFFKSLLQGYKYKGHLYGIPKDYSTLALWWNKTMFAAQHISKPPTTWKAFASDACKLKSNGVYGASLAADPARWLAFAYAAGAGSLFNSGLNKVTFKQGPAASSLSYYAGLGKKGCAARPDQTGTGWNGEAFGKQKVAMTIEGNWMTSYLHDSFPSVKYGIAPLPKGPKGTGNISFTAAYVMYAHTHHLKQATTLLKFLTSKAGETDWAHLNGYIPSRSDAKPLAYTTVFIKQTKNAKEWFFPPGVTSVITGPASDDIRKVMEGKTSAKAAVSDMVSRLNNALNSGV